MKILVLTRNQLDLARSQLGKPMLLIGRSPTCDIVLRAPGIEPVHFLIEWLGGGVFKPEGGNWSITDVSGSPENSEGMVLNQKGLEMAGIRFRIVDSVLESRELLGGTILGSIESKMESRPDLLEFVQLRTDSGAIEEVRHLPLNRKKGKKQNPSKTISEFRVEVPKNAQDRVIHVLFDQMPGAMVMLSGKKVLPTSVLSLKPNDLLKVQWNGRNFYLRLVEQVSSPFIPYDFWGSKLLRNCMLLGVGLASLIGLYVRFAPVTEEPPPAEEPRIARVEIPAPPPPPEPTPMPEVVKETIKEESPPEKQQAAAGRQTAPAAPKVTKAPEAKKRQGLNNEAQVADVNKIGLLGALNRQPDKGSGVKVEHLIDQSIIKQTVTAQESAQVMIRTPPTGTLGVGAGGDPRSKTAVKDLSAASTALSGVKAMKTDSTGIMAGPGGKQNFSLGSGSGDSEAGSGAGGKGIGTMDGGEFSISGGGLDRDTVRRVIHSYKSQIRTCYERALLANPSFEGRVSYKWTITPTGVVVSAHIHKESVQSTNLKNCVLEVIQLMKFPVAGNGKPTVVIYPFVFQGKR